MPHLAEGSSSFTPSQQQLIDLMNRGQYDWTFGPGSPNPTAEDLQTYVGGRYSPAGGFQTEGGWALAPADYYSFTPEQRRELGIMDIAPANQAGRLERWFGGGRGGTSLPGRMVQSGRDVAGRVGNRVGEMFGGGDWGRGSDLPGFYGQSGGVPYYPEGSRMSETLGPLLESAWGDSGGSGSLTGDQIRAIIGSDYTGDRQASNNPLDYLNPFGGTTKGGSGTGVPTQKAIGTGVGTLSNLLLPGSGFLTGPLARWATNLIQHGWTPQQVQAAVAQGKAPKMPSGSVSLPTAPAPTQASQGFSPTGQRPVGREWWSTDFGRGLPSGEAGQGPGDWNPAGPGLGTGHFGTGFGSGTVGNFATAIGFGGNLGGGIGAGNLENLWGGRMAQPSAGPMTAEQWGASPMGSGQAGGQLASFIAQNTPGLQAPTYQDYLSSWTNAPRPVLPIGEVTRGTPQKRIS